MEVSAGNLGGHLNRFKDLTYHEIEPLVDWGVPDKDHPNIGVLRTNPEIIVRYSIIEADTEDAARSDLKEGQQEHMRLRRSGVRVPVYAGLPVQNDGGKWDAFLITSRLYGVRPRPGEPEHTPALIRLGRNLLRYYDQTPAGKPYLGDISACYQYMHCRPDAWSKDVGSIALCDIDALIGIHRQPVDYMPTIATCAMEVRGWLQEIPDKAVTAPVIRYAEEVHERVS